MGGPGTATAISMLMRLSNGQEDQTAAGGRGVGCVGGDRRIKKSATSRRAHV
jgi:hypothetical protein